MIPPVTVRSLTCGVSPEVYDRYQAALPEGLSVNAHLKMLVDEFLTVHDAFSPGMTREIGSDGRIVAVPDQAHPWTPTAAYQDSHPVPDRDVPRETGDPDVCLHPRGAQRRAGHAVECGLCGKTLAVA